MATITTDTYLDDGTARTAAEAWTMNGGILTVRSDTRWHEGSPAAAGGCLGSVTISPTLGGGYFIDATQTRWMAYDGGSGTVPAVGTTITGGTSGSSGYLLGVWASLTSFPSTPGSALPATGFIKLREATALFVDNDVLSGITATANGVDVNGWIEVVHQTSTAITVPRLGKFQTRGNWFYLTNTSGSSNQIIQIPTNGSSTTYVPGAWIETGVGTDIYEYYPSLYAGAFVTANLGTDERSKFVLMGTDGTIRIGHNGTTTVGYVPPSGCKVRVPNIFGRQCTSAARQTNAIPSATAGTRPDFTTTGGAAIDMEYFATDWYIRFIQPFSVRIVNSSTFDYILLSEVATAMDINNVGTSISQNIASRVFNATSCFAGGTITNCNFQKAPAASNQHCFEFVYCRDFIVDNVITGIITFARSTGKNFQATQSSNLTFNNCKSINSGLQLTTCKNISINNFDHTDRYFGTTNTTGIYAIYILASSDNIVVDGVTFGFGGTIANNHPYLGVFNYGQSSNLKIRNLGTRTTFLDGGSSNNPAYICVSAGNNDTVKFQRCYVAPTRTGAISTLNSDKNNIFEHVYGTFGRTMNLASLNGVVKNCGGTTSVTGQASVYGTHFWDAFTSDTGGRVTLSMNEQTTETSSYVTYVSGAPEFTSAGDVSMPTVGDEIIIEQQYFVKGCTALPSTAPVVTGTNVTYTSGPSWGNHDIYYQINTGSGYGGTWKDFNGTNLATETISPSTGFKLKYRIVINNTNSANAIRYIRMNTTSTLAAQIANLYTLDTSKLTIAANASLVGSEVRIYDNDNTPAGSFGTELAGTESSVASSYSYDGVPGNNIIIQVMKSGYKEYIQNISMPTADSNIDIILIRDIIQ